MIAEREKLEEIMIHTIDLHYHAGQERAEGTTLEMHLQHARLSGRKILGLTDHLGRYLNAAKPGHHYPATVEGQVKYRDQVNACKENFPDLTLYFAPEIGPREELDKIPDAVVEIADYFIGEILFPSDDIRQNTETYLTRFSALHDFSKQTGKEIFVAHPFRSAVNRRLVKHDPEPWVYSMAPRWNGEFSLSELESFFMLDLKSIAEASETYRLPLEINGDTQRRVRCSNLPVALQMLWAALAELRDYGAEFVPGSDQHNFQTGVGRLGGAVPADCFQALGITAKEINFLQRIKNN